MNKERIPVLVGVGQFTEHLDASNHRGMSPQDLAAAAAMAALDDTGVSGLAGRVDILAAVRTVGDSVSGEASRFMAPFGGPDNFPRAVASRIDADPAHAIYSLACGDEPQKLVGEMCERIAAGEFELALVCGAEAIANQRQAQRAGQTLDWSESVDGQCEDRGKGTAGLTTAHMWAHQLQMPTSVYPVFDHARRNHLGLSRQEYAESMGALFERFNRVATGNPYAMSQKSLSAEEIATLSEDNRLIADPYTKAMVARDAVNQGAAAVLTSVDYARELGIPEDKWVYLHGYADVREKGVVERQDLGASPAMGLAYRAALEHADVNLADISYFDMYSCFPIAVFCALDSLGMNPDDPRALTVTGGLPFFGGPGNNYSMHGIASMVELLRRDPGAFGVVGANGGVLSKHSVGVYSTKPVDAWLPCDSTPLQVQIDALPTPAFTEAPHGWATIESYTVIPGKSGAAAVIVGRLEESGERFLAVSAADDQETPKHMLAAGVEPLGSRVQVTSGESINTFSIDQSLSDREGGD